MATLKAKLQAYLSEERGIEEFYRGEGKREKDTLAVFVADDERQDDRDVGCAGKYGKLLELWVKGLSFDWQRLYGDARPRRISLPTYPFAKERYWIEPVARAAVEGTAHGFNGSVPSPLLHRNTSDFSPSGSSRS